jgi:hypothetical protein
VGVGWYVPEEITAGLDDGPEMPTKSTSSSVGDSDHLDVSSYHADEDREWMRWEGGYARCRRPVTVDQTFFTLPEEPATGRGGVAALDSFAFPGDPTILGLAFDKVAFPGPDGDLSAWFVPGTGTRWIVAVHGLGASPREFLRMLDSTRELGMPTLIVTYRNDPGAPATEGALILAGQEEWEDVAAAVAAGMAAMSSVRPVWAARLLSL